MKKVPVYFYYIDVQLSKLRQDDVHHPFREFIDTFSDLLSSLIKEDLLARKYDFSSDQKVIWLDSFEEVDTGCFDLVFKSAKYNHVRTVIDTDNMHERGVIKSDSDGDEEKTHLCIRYTKGQSRFICMHESNYYGMRIERIILYINEKLMSYREQHNSNVIWSIQREIMVCEDFLEELKKMKRVSLLKITVERSSLQNDFLHFAGRDDVKDTVDISIGKIKRNRHIPKNLVKEYYKDMQEGDRIKRVVAEGANDSGPFRLDSELIKMKQYLRVETTPTDEVRTEDFFEKAQILLDTLR